jgi:hypothetical protein
MKTTLNITGYGRTISSVRVAAKMVSMGKTGLEILCASIGAMSALDSWDTTDSMRRVNGNGESKKRRMLI